MRDMKTVVMGLAAALILIVGLGSAEAGQKIKGHFAGFSVSNDIDTDSDGNLGATNSGHATGTYGQSNFSGVGEVDFQNPIFFCQLPGEEPPGTGVGFGLLVANFTHAFEAQGDLYTYDYLEGPGGVFCVDPMDPTGPAFFNGQAAITGGTGRFENATGTFESTCTSLTTYGPDAAGNYSGWQVCDFEAHID